MADTTNDVNILYEYDSLSRTDLLSKVERSGLVVGQGNQRRRETYSYSATGRLASVVIEADSTVTTHSYKYDHLGQRVEQSVKVGSNPERRTRYLLDAQNPTG